MNEYQVVRLTVEFANGDRMSMDVLPTAQHPAEVLPESTCCQLCGWNPKFGQNKDVCFCTMGRHYRISAWPRKLTPDNGSK